GEGSAGGRGADGDALHGGVRGEDAHAEPSAGRGGRPVGGGSVAAVVFCDTGGAGGVAVVPAVGDGAQRVLHSAAVVAAGVRAADVWAGRGQRDREVPGAEPGVAEGAAVVAGPAGDAVAGGR